MRSDPFDYSQYSLDELRDARSHIDREKFAERAAALDRAIAECPADRRARSGKPSDTFPIITWAGAVIVILAILQFLVFALLSGDPNSRMIGPGVLLYSGCFFGGIVLLFGLIGEHRQRIEEVHKTLR